MENNVTVLDVSGKDEDYGEDYLIVSLENKLLFSEITKIIETIFDTDGVTCVGYFNEKKEGKNGCSQT